jgi:hypothetical protein
VLRRAAWSVDCGGPSRDLRPDQSEFREHEAVRAVYTGLDLLTELAKVYADAD